jgi:hypothetical protein
LLLRNQAGAGNHWLGVKLIGGVCNKDAIGAKLVWSAGGVVRSRLKNSGGSYLSSHDPREVLGIGSAAKIESRVINLPPPRGKVEKFTNQPLDSDIGVEEGKGIRS